MKQRIIKFRAWDKKRKQMIYEANDLENGYLIRIDLDGYVNATYKQICFDEDEIILMQDTGLKDKKEKEIYEGDILKCFITGESEDYLQLEAGKKNYVIREISIPEVYQEGLPDDCEIIGNFYDNKTN